MEQLTLAIKFTTTIENRDTFKDILTNLFETISHEKNFVNAIIHQGIQNTNEFFVYENWNDNIQDFLAVQMKKDFVVQFEQSL
jgi:quinol monooxygenase YgiN